MDYKRKKKEKDGSSHRALLTPLSQSPVVKTQTITISDVTNSLCGEVATKEVPIVHTETKTITYEAAQVRGMLGIEVVSLIEIRS